MEFNDICEFFIFEKHVNYYLMFVSLFILLVVYKGYYHLFANIITKYVEELFKIEGNAKIIKFIIKLIIFIKLLNYFIKSILNSFFVNVYDVPSNLDDPNNEFCVRQQIIKKISVLTSTTFFIVYYFFNAPHNIVNDLEIFSKFIIKLLKSEFKDKKKEHLNNLKEHIKNIKNDIDDYLEIYYKDLYGEMDKGVISYIVKQILNLLKKKESSKKTNDKDEQEDEQEDEEYRDKISSIYAGYVSISFPFIYYYIINLHKHMD